MALAVLGLILGGLWLNHRPEDTCPQETGGHGNPGQLLALGPGQGLGSLEPGAVCLWPLLSARKQYPAPGLCLLHLTHQYQ